MVMVEGNRVRELAGFGVSGIARFQLAYVPQMQLHYKVPEGLTTI